MGNLGINTIGTLERPSLIAGDFPRVTQEITAATDLALGSLVITDASGNAVLATDPEEPVYGVVAEDISAGAVGVAWLTGEFVGARLTVGGGDWTDYIEIARSKSIFLKDARLAPNQ